MTEEQLILINELKEKIGTLKSLYNTVSQEKESLLKEKNELTQKIEEQTNIIADLDRKYKSLQLAKAVSSPEGNNIAAQEKIDDLVKEIDKCIALINS